MTNFLSSLFSLKMAPAEAKLKARSEASHQNISNLIFDGKLRFALLASLSNFQRNLS